MTSQSFLIFVVIIKLFFNLIRKKICQLSIHFMSNWVELLKLMKVYNKFKRNIKVKDNCQWLVINF